MEGWGYDGGDASEEPLWSGTDGSLTAADAESSACFPLAARHALEHQVCFAEGEAGWRRRGWRRRGGVRVCDGRRLSVCWIRFGDEVRRRRFRTVNGCGLGHSSIIRALVLRRVGVETGSSRGEWNFLLRSLGVRRRELCVSVYEAPGCLIDLPQEVREGFVRRCRCADAELTITLRSREVNALVMQAIRAQLDRQAVRRVA